MADITTSREDEKTIDDIRFKGLQLPITPPKWTVLRLALAHSLRITSPPGEDLNRIQEKGSEYSLEQVTGQGQGKNTIGQRQDYTDAITGLLSVYSGKDLFADPQMFRSHLQRHVRRGLREFRRGWRESHDFYQFLYQELCTGADRNDAGEELNFSEQLISALKEISVRGEITETVDGPRLTRYLLHLEDPNHLDRVRRGLDKITFALGLQKHGVFLTETGQPKVIGLDVPRQKRAWKAISGPDFLKWVAQPPAGMVLPLWVGVEVTGTPYAIDLAHQPHILVGGTTGSGKSVCLHTLLISLLHGVSKEQLELVLIDPKKVEFAPYAKANSKRIQVITDVDTAQQQLERLTLEMEARTTALEKAGLRNLSEGHSTGRVTVPYIVVFIEELADLIMQAPEAEEHLISLAQKARATGIHLIVATQRPDSRTLNGLLRSNIPTRIALTVQKSTESKIILDETGAERLTGSGDMLIRLAGESLRRLHGVYVTVDDIALAVQEERRA